MKGLGEIATLLNFALYMREGGQDAVPGLHIMEVEGSVSEFSGNLC